MRVACLIENVNKGLGLDRLSFSSRRVFTVFMSLYVQIRKHSLSELGREPNARAEMIFSLFPLKHPKSRELILSIERLHLAA